MSEPVQWIVLITLVVIGLVELLGCAVMSRVLKWMALQQQINRDLIERVEKLEER